jgi:hypothetical protein
MRLEMARRSRSFGTDYPTSDGTCERDFIHVSDLAAADVEALRHLQADSASLTLNLGTGKAASVRSIITAVERIIGRAVPLVRSARRPGDPPVLVADASLARKLIGFTPRLSELSQQRGKHAARSIAGHNGNCDPARAGRGRIGGNERLRLEGCHDFGIFHSSQRRPERTMGRRPFPAQRMAVHRALLPPQIPQNRKRVFFRSCWE